MALKEEGGSFQTVLNILNCSFHEARLPQSWKEADIESSRNGHVTPLLKILTFTNFNTVFPVLV
jgi:hypothetical protein